MKTTRKETAVELLTQRYPKESELNDGAPVVIRLLNGDDAPAMTALFESMDADDVRVMRDDLTNPANVRRLVESHDPEHMLVLVAEVGGEIWGEASLIRHPGTPQAHVGELRMYVAERHRGQGLGSLLIEEVLDLAAEMGLSQLLSDLFLDNVSMISAFERRGFEREAILPVYQMVVMRYDLLARPRDAMLGVGHADKLPPRADWPDLVFDPELLEIPDPLNLCEQLLDRVVAQGGGKRAAIHWRDEVVTYDLLLGEVQRLASGLAHLGLGAGDPVLLHMPNTPQAIAANLAVQRLGAMSVPTIFLLTPAEMAHIVRESGVVAALTTVDHLDIVRGAREASGGALRAIIVDGLEEHLPEEEIYSYARLVAHGSRSYPPVPRGRQEIGMLLYTSSAEGGHPVGTAHRLDGMLAVLDCFGRHAWRVNEDDVICALAPLGFPQNIITCGMMPFRFGASAALPDDPMAHSGVALGQTIQKHRVTLIWGSPLTYRQMLAADFDELALASLRLCSSGGEPLTRATYEAWEARFHQPIFEGFGTTELLYGFLSNAVGMAPRIGSLGRVVPGYTVRVVGEQGQELGPNEFGYMAVRGPTGTIYWNDPAAQRRSLHSGWNRLRDYAYYDADGYFWFVARRDDLIKSGSFRIDPAEVERALERLHGVREAAVIGLPDAMRGQRAVACVVPREEGAGTPELAQRLLQRLREELAEYKVPSEILFVPSLPRNSLGQLQRNWLRDQMRPERE